MACTFSIEIITPANGRNSSCVTPVLIMLTITVLIDLGGNVWEAFDTNASPAPDSRLAVVALSCIALA